MDNARSIPVGGQSHWCDGWTADHYPCRQIVLNASDHCEAGHKNSIRVTLLIDVPVDSLTVPADATEGLVSLSIDDISDSSCPLEVTAQTEDKKRDIVEDLREQCFIQSRGITCSERDILPGDMCEYCRAADEVKRLRTFLEEGRVLANHLKNSTDIDSWLHKDSQDWLRRTTRSWTTQDIPN